MPQTRPQQLHFALSLLLISLFISGSIGFHFPTSRTKQQHHAPKKTNRQNHKSNKRTQLAMTSSYTCPNETTKQIYNIKDSGWSSPTWNWGSARGTGHDCAAICRRRWSSKSDRKELVNSLLNPVEFKATHPQSEVPFEEIKLILGLAWQNGRWDGSDGGPDGYPSVLATMAAARRYEDDDEVISALNFIQDVSMKFDTISRNADELKLMKSIANDVGRGKRHHAGKEEVFMARRTCAGLVLDAMNFVDKGL